MTTTQYHGKVYKHWNGGTLFTKTPYGNVLCKNQAHGFNEWLPCEWTPDDIDWCYENGYLEVVEVK